MVESGIERRRRLSDMPPRPTATSEAVALREKSSWMQFSVAGELRRRAAQKSSLCGADFCERRQSDLSFRTVWT